MKDYRIVFVALAVVLSGMALPTLAEPEPTHPQLAAKHTFILGGFRQSVDGEFYAQADGRPKRSIDFDDLGVSDTKSSFMGEYRYRMNDKWMFTVGGFRFNAEDTVAAEKEFEYDGVVFEAGAKIDTELRIDTYMLEALYSVYKTDRAEILLGGGLHMFDFGAELKAKVFVGDQERTGKQASDDILAPLPNLRAQGFYAITPKWAVSGAVGWLSADYEDYSGAFTYVHVRTMYRLTEHFGMGVGYQHVDVDLTVDGSDVESGFDIQFSGPTAYLAYSF